MGDEIRHFKDLVVWQKAHELEMEIYCLTKGFPKQEIFGLTNQLRRAASSVAANIAEGMGRGSYADRQRFYYQARGSLYEVESYLITAKDLAYMCQEKYSTLMNLLEVGRKLLNGFINTTGKFIPFRRRAQP